MIKTPNQIEIDIEIKSDQWVKDNIVKFNDWLDEYGVYVLDGKTKEFTTPVVPFAKYQRLIDIIKNAGWKVNSEYYYAKHAEKWYLRLEIFK